MEIVMRKVSELTPYEKNPRLNDKAVEACKESIRQYGFKVPIIVDRNGVIVAGHTRMRAAKALGMETVPVIVADDLSDEQIRAFRIADNKVSDFSIWDNRLLLEELEAITEYDEDLFTGFEMAELPGMEQYNEDGVDNKLDADEVGAMYEVVFKSEDKEKIGEYIDELRGRGFAAVIKESFLAVLSPVIILGSIYSGIASPTEAAVISVFYALLIGLVVYREIKLSELYHLFLEAVGTYTPILFIMAAAIAFSRVLTLMQVPQTVSSWILANFTSKVIVLLVINIFLLIVGMFMDTTPAILILTPILLPIVKGFGMTGIHFGVMMVVNLAIGYVTPPIGVNLFVASAMTDIPVMDISKKAIPLICMFIIALLLITFIPAISLLLV
jgi:TRAP-type mannitol/chloroaromatic compound transport system permease large subunit